MRKLALLVLVLAFGCGKKKDDAPAASSQPAVTADKPAAATADKPADKPATPAAAPVRDPAKLPGTWHIDGRPEVVWTFKPDGGVHIKTSVTEYDGNYTLDGTKLTIAAKDTKTKVYDVAEMSDAALALTDAEYSDTTRWVH